MRFLLLSAMALLGAGSLNAQTYQEPNRFELALNGGLARISIPKESMYTGQTTYWRPYAALKALYTIREYFQVGFEVNGSRWETSDNQVPVTGYGGKPLGTDTVRYIFARPALTFLASASAVIPLFTNYRYNNVADVHLGVGLGPVITLNDGANSTHEYSSNDENNRMSYLNTYAFKPGSGWAFGFQAGYTHYIKEHIGIGAEYSPRFYRINTRDEALAGRNSEFTLWTHPISLSIRYRW